MKKFLKGIWRAIKKVIGVICLIMGIMALYSWITTVSFMDTSFAIWSFIGLSLWFLFAYALLYD